MELDWKNATLKDAISDYYVYAGYTSRADAKHDLGHLLATSLLDTEHMMDWDLTKRNMPKTRIADYAVEPIADTYWMALMYYPPTSSGENIWKDGLRNAYNYSCDGEASSAQALLHTVKRLSYNVMNNDLTMLEKSGQQVLPDTEGSPAHRAARLRYVRNPDSIQWPSLREIEYHMGKAVEFCETFAAAHGGKYPNQYTDEEILALPLTDFTIKHEFPNWLREEWAAQRAAAAPTPGTRIL